MAQGQKKGGGVMNLVRHLESFHKLQMMQGTSSKILLLLS